MSPDPKIASTYDLGAGVVVRTGARVVGGAVVGGAVVGGAVVGAAVVGAAVVGAAVVGAAVVVTGRTCFSCQLGTQAPALSDQRQRRCDWTHQPPLLYSSP